MKNLTFLIPAIAFLAIASTAHAQDATPQTASPPEPKTPKPYVPLYGGNLGFEQLLSSSTRRTFGNSGISFTPGFGPVFAKKGMMLVPGFGFLNLSKESGGVKNKALLISLGPSLRFGPFNPFDAEMEDGNPKLSPKLFSPYAEVGLRLVYSDVSVPTESVDSKRVTAGGVVTVGVGIRKNAFIQAKLTLLPKINSYDFSTCAVEFGVRF